MSVFNLCRICLTEDTNTNEMEPLFEENARCAELVQKIEACGGIVLKPQEEFPKMICGQCLESLNTSYKFREICQASENALLDAIVKSEFKTEPLTDITHASDDEDNKMFFDMHRTEFIDAHEVSVADIANVVASDSSCDGDKERAADGSYSDSGSECATLAKLKSRRMPFKKEALPSGVPRKRGRPRLLNRACPKPKGRKVRKKNAEVSSVPGTMCELCGNIYAKMSLLNLHMRRHMSEKPFECEICGKSFACPSEIGRHMRIHTGEKPYVCRFCGRSFADRSSNIKHERIHTNERPFTCKTCGKSFTYSNVLKNHMLTHTGEKPFRCMACDKTFSRKHQLDQHCGTLTHQQTVKNLAISDPAAASDSRLEPVVEMISQTPWKSEGITGKDGVGAGGSGSILINSNSKSLEVAMATVAS